MGTEMVDLRKKVREISDYHRIVLDTLREIKNYRKVPEFVEIIDDVQSFQEKLERAYDGVQRSFNEEVYIGIVGRYSHGKTALVNAIFGLTGDDELPVGEGIVTSKICNVGFTKGAGNKTVKIVYENGREEIIDLSTSKQLIKGVDISDIDESLIAYIAFNLPEIPENTFSQQMAEKNIRLIDMPGLGGKYFSDTELTRKYIGACDALLIIIKATEVEQAARVLNNVLTARKPKIVIPVVTFYDLTESSPKFVGLDEDEKQNLIKKEISENIPYLNSFIDQVIFVSSKTGLNIDELRKYIYNRLFGITITAIKGIEDAINPVFQRKSEEFLKSLSIYTSVIKAIRERIEKSVQRFEEIELNPIESELEDEFDDFISEIDNFCTKTVQKTLYEAKSQIELLRHVENQEEFENIRKKAKLAAQNYSVVNIKNFQKEIERIIDKRIKKIITLVKKVAKDEKTYELILKRSEAVKSEFEYHVENYFSDIDYKVEKAIPSFQGIGSLEMAAVSAGSKLKRVLERADYVKFVTGIFIVAVVGIIPDKFLRLDLKLIKGIVSIVGFIFMGLGITPGISELFSKSKEAKIRLKEKANEAYQRSMTMEKELSSEFFKVLRQVAEEYFESVREIFFGKKREITDGIKTFYQIIRELNKQLKDLEKLSSEIM